jgi:hypothetical protein
LAILISIIKLTIYQQVEYKLTKLTKMSTKLFSIQRDEMKPEVLDGFPKRPLAYPIGDQGREVDDR